MTEAIERDPLSALLERAHGELDVEAPVEGLSRLKDTASWRRAQAGPLRRARWIAAVFSVLWLLDVGRMASALSIVRSAGAWRLGLALGIPLVVFWTAVRWAGRSDFAAQVLSRVLVLTTCMVGASVTILQDPTFSSQLALALGSSIPKLVVPFALLLAAVLGPHGLHTASRRPPQTGFEMLLALSLVMGLADAVFMLFVGMSKVGVVTLGPWPFVLPAVLGVAGYGLLRGRVWGLLLMALGNLAEVVLIFDESLFGSSLVTGSASFVLVLTASVQVLLPAPVYAAMLMPSRRWVTRLQRADGPLARVLAVVIATLLAVSALLSSLLGPVLAESSGIIS